MDKLAYDRRYSQDAREKRNADDREFATVQAQMMGAEVVKPEQGKSLLDTAIESGARVRG